MPKQQKTSADKTATKGQWPDLVAFFERSGSDLVDEAEGLTIIERTLATLNLDGDRIAVQGQLTQLAIGPKDLSSVAGVFKAIDRVLELNGRKLDDVYGVLDGTPSCDTTLSPEERLAFDFPWFSFCRKDHDLKNLYRQAFLNHLSRRRDACLARNVGTKRPSNKSQLARCLHLVRAQINRTQHEDTSFIYAMAGVLGATIGELLPSDLDLFASMARDLVAGDGALPGEPAFRAYVSYHVAATCTHHNGFDERTLATISSTYEYVGGISALRTDLRAVATAIGRQLIKLCNDNKDLNELKEHFLNGKP